MYAAVQGTPPAPHGDAVGQAGRYVLAPALGGFVRWLVHAALQSGKTRLYFLARDGYFFYHAARIYCKKRGLPLDCRYLYCSRYALRVPLFHRDREGALDFICRDGLYVSPSRLLLRAGLTGPEKAVLLDRLRLPFSSDQRIPSAMLPQIRRALAGCREFWEAVSRRSREALPGLAGYLRQEGLLDELPYAVVDSGWVGSMQKSLGDALALLGRRRPLEGYYWGLYELPAGVRRVDYHPYYFGPEGRIARKAAFNNCLFEAVYTAPHGMTLGYRREGGAYRPVLAPQDEAGRAFTRRLEPVLLAYVRQLAETPGGEPGAGGFARDRRTISRLFRLLMARPTRREAEAFGRLAYSADVLAPAAEGDPAASHLQGGAGILGADGPAGGEQLAAPLSKAALRAGHALPQLLAAAGLGGAGQEQAEKSAWYEGSAVRAGGQTARHLRQYRLAQYLRLLRQARRNQTRRRKNPHG